MKRILWVILVLFICQSIIGCKADSDVLETYKDGKITRAEFYKHIDFPEHESRLAVTANLSIPKNDFNGQLETPRIFPIKTVLVNIFLNIEGIPILYNLFKYNLSIS